ncbi:hypothetical protein C8A00DRAFT_18724 [Chaetomidium leptoderma]|uniref:Mg2+ transporter protein, CorA-like/Zinc transport protein ZntB n=1 Tax=Chaetomidium leptoderma TaxID=669021 RepID=A0AAN6VFK8_9PEZI|nr:hypothetical protein C8A00DRAFT_18724 [Chaetomidium leptoderma]
MGIRPPPLRASPLERSSRKPPHVRFRGRKVDDSSSSDELGDGNEEDLAFAEDWGSDNYTNNRNPVFYTFGDLASKDNGGSVGLSDNEFTAVPEEEQEMSHGTRQEGSAPDAIPDANLDAAAYHVLGSNYTGEGYEGGGHSAKLTAILSKRAAVPQSMFRWIRSAALRDMVNNIKRGSATTVQASDMKYVRRMEPKLRHETLLSEGKVLGSRSVTWVCLPYFSLEPYSGLLGANSTKSFPTPTLLQARYPRTARNRDMQQAVCQQKGVSRGLCFHISQLWCLILDNSLLVTYGRLTEKALCEDIIVNDAGPLPTPPAPIPNKTLSVRYQGTLMWTIPIQDCQTWFPGVLFPLSTADVDTAVHADKQEAASVDLTSRQDSTSPGSVASLSKEDHAGLASPSLTPPKENRHTSEPEIESSRGVFTYLDCFAKPGMSSTTSPTPSESTFFNETTAKKYFSDLEDHILNKTVIGDRRVYRSIEEIERSAVHAVMDSERLSMDLGEPSAEHQQDFDGRVIMFNAADAVFKFFFPLDTRVATVGRYWGAVLALIKVRYQKLLESDITTGHADRRIDLKLGLFRQELSIIDWTIDMQTSILRDLLRTRESVAQRIGAQFKHPEPQRYQPEQLPYMMPPQHDTIAAMAEGVLKPGAHGQLEPCGFSYMLLHECERDLSLKKKELRMMRDAAFQLRKTNETNLTHTKDRQERAIYAFTIVTVIFLPLSAVASIFGMNSSDIRDMDLGQWAYWATAGPVTAVVVFLGLLFTGELGNVRSWVEERVERWGWGGSGGAWGLGEETEAGWKGEGGSGPG